MNIPESYRGTDISYVAICKRRAWLSLHEIYITDGSDFVKIGAFKSEIKRKYGYSEMSIGRNKLDYIEDLQNGKTVIHEFKRGRKGIEADVLQLTHYMQIASIRGLEVDHGELHLLESKKVECIQFPNQFVEKVDRKYHELDDLLVSEIPSAKRNYYCKHGCSYVEFCWS